MSTRSFLIHGHRIVAKSASAGLHIVSTPIGNLADISLRALETLAGADVILAEDTRVSRKLLTHYGIGTPCHAFHEHSGPAARQAALDRLAAGEAVALISDAGTPILSDPGAELVKAAVAAGAMVIPVPGASALLAALVASGMADGGFTFAGFLPARGAERRQVLQQLAGSSVPLIFYEAPHRLVETLEDAASLLGDRRAVVARELTKHFETFQRGALSELLQHYRAEEPRGEIVLMIAPAAAEAPSAATLDDRLMEALKQHRIRDAAQIVAAALGLPKRQVYARALELQALSEKDGADGAPEP